MSLLDCVNIRQGSQSQSRFSSGNTLPLTALPHALAAFAPQTSAARGGWWYHPQDRSLEGIRLTHQPSPWVGDFSWFCFMPQADGFFVSENDRWSGYRADNAAMCPHELDLIFLRYGARVRLAPTDTGAVAEITFDEDRAEPRFAILPPDCDSQTKANISERLVTGYTTSRTAAPYRDDFKCWFAFSFDCDIGEIRKADDRSHGISVRLFSHRATVRLAISYLSEEQALFNLHRDTDGKSFERAKTEAGEVWEQLLSTVRLKADEEICRTFYSCMYRAFLYPTKFYETDCRGRHWHVVPQTGELREGVMYTNNGFWDTYRTVYPFYALVIPEKLREILEGFLNIYDDTGFLPRWPSPSETGCMPGMLIEAVFADAAAKGVLSRDDCRRALRALLDNAAKQSADSRYGRKCISEYEKFGYIPFDKCNESVNETLDCAYGDFCISVVAQAAGEQETAERFARRAGNYRNLFDAKEGFFRAKDSRGDFRREIFDPFAWGRDYTEGSAWQNGFAVPHDIDGLVSLYGGTTRFEAKLDELFSLPPSYRVGGYGFEIHEMTEMAAADLGQCAISNQPSFSIPYLYAALGKKEKTDYWVRKIVKEYFSSRDDGFPGDEDNGTMACWYLFSVLGFYPLCPGKQEYIVGGGLGEAEIMVRGKAVDCRAHCKGKQYVVFPSNR